MRKYFSFVIILQIFGLFFLLAPNTLAHAYKQNPYSFDSDGTANFYPLAPCPSCTTSSSNVSASIAPISPSSTAPYPSTSSGINISSVPSVTPCSASGATVAHGRKSKHKQHDGGVSNFMEALLRFFVELINMLLKLFGGGQIPTPQPETGNPAPTTDPGCDPAPSIPAPTQSASIPSTQPSIIPSVLVPSNPVTAECTNPIWTSADPNGMREINGFFVHNNMWNASSYPDTKQTIYACAQNNWYVTSTANDAGDGAVKTYPNVHKDYNGVALSSFTSVSSSYAHIAPAGGNWNVAYDIWINGIGNGNGSTELMIWTEAVGKQAEAVKTYPSIGIVTLSGITYNVHKSDAYIVFEMTPYKNSGTINLKEIFDYILSKGLIPANSTLGQIGYGVEVVSTNGAASTFKFANFSITTN